MGQCRSFRVRRSVTTALVSLLAATSVGAALPASAESAPAQQAHSTVLRVTVHSRALEGNLEGDSPDRDVSVYLPPGYSANRGRHYPVLYMLHGFTETDLSYFGAGTFTNIPTITDRALANGTARDMIIVTPNAKTVYGGSNYSSGATTGDWETFISRELVSYVDKHFRTIRDRAGRGLAGHSMGGYGTLRIGMKHPDVFSALYVLSSCCISPTSNIPDTPEEIATMEAYTAHPEDYTGVPAGIGTAVAAAASWAPNPGKAPLYFDSPFKDGVLQPAVFARMTANRPLAMVDQYIPTLRTQKIAFDVGNLDTNIAANLTELDRILTSYHVSHSFEVYEGNHTNRIPERFETKVLPFFAQQLRSAR